MASRLKTCPQCDKLVYVNGATNCTNCGRRLVTTHIEVDDAAAGAIDKSHELRETLRTFCAQLPSK